jgi:hypothetical protein
VDAQRGDDDADQGRDTKNLLGTDREAHGEL